CFLALLTRVAIFGARPATIILPLAVTAGLTLFARVHVAIGLYFGVCCIVLIHFWHEGWTDVTRATGALAVLFLFGASLLYINELRFGNVFRFIGSLERGAPLQYGFFFWGIWEENAPRAKTVMDYGTFHVGRILPNLLIYAIDIPATFLSDWIEYLHRWLTQ